MVEGQYFSGRASKAVGTRVIGKAFYDWLVLPEYGYLGRYVLPL